MVILNDFMRDVLPIIATVVGILGTIMGTLGITTYVNEKVKHKVQAKTKQEEEQEATLQEARRQKYKDELREIIREENKELKEDISSIKSELALNKRGTVTILRNDMKKSLDLCKDKGYATTSDKSNWNELYNTYKELGGNHFKEYVNGWKQEMEELPLKKATRKKLNESKK